MRPDPKVYLGGLPSQYETQWFRESDVIAVCRNGGRLEKWMSRHMVIYRDPTQQYGVGRMPISKDTFPQAVKEVQSWGVAFLPLEFGGPQEVSHARVNPNLIASVGQMGEKGGAVFFDGVQYWDRYYFGGQAEDVLAKMPHEISRHFAVLDEPTDSITDHEWRTFHDVRTIAKVKLACWNDGPAVVQVLIGEHWHPIRSKSLGDTMVKIERHLRTD